MADKLFLYTMNFPFGNGEAFLEAELEILSKTFEAICIIPLNFGGDIRQLPENVNVINLSEQEGDSSGALSYFFKAKMKLVFFKDIRYQWSNFRQIISRSKKLSNYLNNETGIHYSYWLDEWAIILAILKSNGTINNFISRTHGFDLYEERARLGYNPWRKFVFDHIEKVYSISKMGVDYLVANYPVYKQKFTHSYLGSQDYGLSKSSDSDSFHLVSCSNVISLKRVGRIVSALMRTELKIQWSHIGSGIEMDSVEKLAADLPSNITHHFLGSISHEEVMNYYKSNSVDCFVNVSTTEGLPVSMMEAISYGIPILATDVGGVNEIVTTETGVLITTDFTDELLALAIEKFASQQLVFERDKIREYWLKKFYAAENYTDFGEKLKGNYVI